MALTTRVTMLSTIASGLLEPFTSFLGKAIQGLVKTVIRVAHAVVALTRAVVARTRRLSASVEAITKQKTHKENKLDINVEQIGPTHQRCGLATKREACKSLDHFV